MTTFTPPPVTRQFSVRTIGLEMCQAAFAVCPEMVPTLNDGPDLRGALDLHDALAHDVHVPHDHATRGDRGLARQSILLATRRLCPTRRPISKLSVFDEGSCNKNTWATGGMIWGVDPMPFAAGGNGRQPTVAGMAARQAAQSRVRKRLGSLEHCRRLRGIRGVIAPK